MDNCLMKKQVFFDEWMPPPDDSIWNWEKLFVDNCRLFRGMNTLIINQIIDQRVVFLPLVWCWSSLFSDCFMWIGKILSHLIDFEYDDYRFTDESFISHKIVFSICDLSSMCAWQRKKTNNDTLLREKKERTTKSSNIFSKKRKCCLILSCT